MTVNELGYLQVKLKSNNMSDNESETMSLNNDKLNIFTYLKVLKNSIGLYMSKEDFNVEAEKMLTLFLSFFIEKSIDRKEVYRFKMKNLKDFYYD